MVPLVACPGGAYVPWGSTQTAAIRVARATVTRPIDTPGISPVGYSHQHQAPPIERRSPDERPAPLPSGRGPYWCRAWCCGGVLGHVDSWCRTVGNCDLDAN